LARVAEEGAHKTLRARAARVLRVMVLSVLSFTVNEVPVRAAALSFTTVLAFIPLTIILSSVAGWLGYLDLMPSLIPYFVSSLNLDLPLDAVLEGIERAQGIGFHQLGLVGSLGLLIGFFLSMSNVEEAMNRVWNVRQDRNWVGRFRRYTPFLLMLAMLLVGTVFMLHRVRRMLVRWGWGYEFSISLPGSAFLFGALGFMFFLAILIFLMIRVLPNTRVRVRSALYGSLAATFMLYLLSRALLIFPSFLMERNLVFYGSLVIFPVALLLIYAFWITVLFGSAVAFVHDNLQHTMGRHFFARGSSGMMKDWREAVRETQELYLLNEGPVNQAAQEIVKEINADIKEDVKEEIKEEIQENREDALKK
jgi:YihY family inner membrane protein